MRLHALDRGHRLRERLAFLVIPLLRGRQVPDVVKLLRYRPDFFGRPMRQWTEAVLRGPSAWSEGERALFGAFTSRLNQCAFWTGAAGAVASLTIGNGHTVQAVLADWRTAPVHPAIGETLGFLEKLTRQPATVSPADVAPLRAARVSDRAVAEAIHVCAVFSVFNRLADAFRFRLPGPDEHAALGALVVERGYLL